MHYATAKVSSTLTGLVWPAFRTIGSSVCFFFCFCFLFFVLFCFVLFVLLCFVLFVLFISSSFSLPKGTIILRMDKTRRKNQSPQYCEAH